MALRNDDPRLCPGSRRLGDWRKCPVCDRDIWTRTTSIGEVVPNHLPPKED